LRLAADVWRIAAGGLSAYRNQVGGFMTRDRNTFAKRQRETGKRQKAAEKKIRRQKRKEAGPTAEAGDAETREGEAREDDNPPASEQ
jgi:hypothetical protein